MPEKEHQPTVAVHELPPMGYGNAESSISRRKQLENGELSLEVDAKSKEIINSGEILLDVNDTDDGCIDGRGTYEVYMTERDQIVLKRLEDNSNHERAKVAGGGYITAHAIRLGLGQRGDSVDQDISQLGSDLAAQGIYCGAHTGAHKHGEGTDCGANDKMPLILQQALTYKDQVTQTSRALIEAAGLAFDESEFERVLSNWQDALEETAYFSDSTGATRLQRILATQAAASDVSGGRKPVAVTKHLEGDHNEDYIIVNYIAGKTVSQGVLAEQLRDAFPGRSEKNLAQAFVVDAWRIVELAKASVDESEVEAGIYAGVAYQVATAATLTDGTLPVFTYTAG